MEVRHVCDIFLCFNSKFNNHYFPYSEGHPDPLERRIYQYPDVEEIPWNHYGSQWYVASNLYHAFNAVYRHAVILIGDALGPDRWNRREPWLSYDFARKLRELGMPDFPRPSTFREGAHTAPFDSLEDLQREVHVNNLYAICLVAIAKIVDAVKMNGFSNLVLADYMRSSPALIAGHRYWCRTVGYVILDRSEDAESAANFEQLIEEQRESQDALALATPPDSISPMELSSVPASPDRAFNAIDWRNGEQREDIDCGTDPFAVANTELVRTLRNRRDDIHIPSDVASTSSPPMVPSADGDFDFDNLVDRLAEISAFWAAREATGFGNDQPEPKWEWPTKPASHEDPAIGSPHWPSQ
ncbi:hypothetical protein RSOLAG22IIIB_09964 [Rhizoctonia solani]|uniref:Uncharacterized protein n=1 Tax=Rhizoctonia solani TaxID=456999 RepID=A0A0K6G0A8_9AGAM|nr:hypothetical protein RSOLAG22IIIB_09964 [Rhizoctonia solani]